MKQKLHHFYGMSERLPHVGTPCNTLQHLKRLQHNATKHNIALYSWSIDLRMLKYNLVNKKLRYGCMHVCVCVCVYVGSGRAAAECFSAKLLRAPVALDRTIDLMFADTKMY